MLRWIATATVGALVGSGALIASPALMEQHCATCHNEEKAKGKFKLGDLGERPTSASLERWLDALDLVTSEEMPPEDESELSAESRKELIAYFKGKVTAFKNHSVEVRRTKSRRLNNREFANSVRDVLMIEDIGTHLPADNLIGDSLHEGFDTHGETLGFSKFHLEQHIETVRKIVDATILSGERPKSKRYEFDSTDVLSAHTSQNITRPERRGEAEGFDFLDPSRPAYFEGFESVPHTGFYKVTIRATGKDRGRYTAEDTGVYHGDPIRMAIRMGDREKVVDLPDEETLEFMFHEWMAAGSRLQLRYPTDGLRMRGNGNFKFQYAIAGHYLKEHQPALWQKVADGIETRRSGRKRPPESWHHWVNHWAGPRPRVFGAVVEGPLFKSWPPMRQKALLGEKPSVENAEAILRPIAERAWRRPVREGELDEIVALVRSKAASLDTIEAIKEGIVAILVSPAFLLHNLDDLTDEERFASKLSYFLGSTIPDASLQREVASGRLGSFDGVKAEVRRRFEESEADPFLREFPFGWLKLNDINFMAPDPDQYRFYHRKSVSDDMVDEALQFFRHAIEHNIPIPEFLSADYSFINADLAQIYGVEGVPQDSKLRKHTFDGGRRGGLLGMAAFLTVTADSLSTSPIHRAIYVMENFMGIHPKPPPPDVEITEPDVRQARTVKEILEAHRSDPSCASCHQSIDPYGYAFENFDPTGAWRDVYTVPRPAPADSVAEQVAAKKRRPKDMAIPIDASAKFRNGIAYRDIVGYRAQLLTEANRDRFVRCFISKLLAYANGAEPLEADYVEIDRILAKSAENGYRLVDTIAAVIDSPLFREE